MTVVPTEVYLGFINGFCVVVGCWFKSVTSQCTDHLCRVIHYQFRDQEGSVVCRRFTKSSVVPFDKVGTSPHRDHTPLCDTCGFDTSRLINPLPTYSVSSAKGQTVDEPSRVPDRGQTVTEVRSFVRTPTNTRCLSDSSGLKVTSSTSPSYFLVD